jgi:hypothetical protein
MMRIWKLTPTDLTEPIWKKWSPEPIIVRAESEAEGSAYGRIQTNKYFPPLPPMPMPVSLGGHKKKGDPSPRPTLCEDIGEQTDEYSVDGPAEVLRHGEEV